jgi:tetratricopeptide (TPR) repeat protein
VPIRMNAGVALAALGLFAIGSSALAADPVDACGPRKLTKKLEKLLGAAQEARVAKNWEEVVAKVREADAVPVEKTEYDRFWMHEFQGIAFANLKQFPDAIRELDASINSPCMEEAEKPGRGKLLLQLAYQSKDYPKAIEYGKRALPGNPDPEVGLYLANAYYIQNDYQNTRTVITDVISKMEASGKPPDEQTYRILQSACVNLKDDPCVVAQIEKLVLHYPKPAYWQDLTNSLLRISSNDRELINILRLADGVGVLDEGGEYVELAQLAVGQGLPGESQAILEKGFQKGAFSAARDKDRATRLLSEAKTAVALDKSTLTKQDAAAKAKPTGDADVKLGAAYLSYGEGEKAIEALQRGIGKGGVKNPDEAGLLLGIAYVRANNKPEAIKAFGTVNKNPTMARIAKLWVLSVGGAAAT